MSEMLPWYCVYSRRIGHRRRKTKSRRTTIKIASIIKHSEWQHKQLITNVCKQCRRTRTRSPEVRTQAHAHTCAHIHSEMTFVVTETLLRKRHGHMHKHKSLASQSHTRNDKYKLNAISVRAWDSWFSIIKQSVCIAARESISHPIWRITSIPLSKRGNGEKG